MQKRFSTKREALDWEREFLRQKRADVDMTFESFTALYEKDVKPKLKENTWLSRESVIKKKLLPYFGQRKLSEITAKDVIDWQNEMRGHKDGKGKLLYPIIGKYGIEKPHTALRKMRTLWGSCSVKQETVTFNQYLIKAKPACVEYVVLHELVHFLYPNHSKQFYDFLSIQMPDWKERKKVLDLEVVHGL